MTLRHMLVREQKRGYRLNKRAVPCAAHRA
jgi:hypothetical protein